ncbi:hypothetical protein T11_15482 [Trichinella zimbabwensis]|uniref:Uncharacterized protein n=1 Tax=Trichinella zimbabwensis TaxID=268475 RepID=A0A0V1HG15_9BILA|nr:hypothetical protein T11_15482 [Trichinella zimbabwensis]
MAEPQTLEEARRIAERAVQSYRVFKPQQHTGASVPKRISPEMEKTLVVSTGRAHYKRKSSATDYGRQSTCPYVLFTSPVDVTRPLIQSILWATSEQWHKKTPASWRLEDKERRGKIRATKVGPLERAEQSPLINGATGGQAVCRDPEAGSVYRTLNMARDREEPHGEPWREKLYRAMPSKEDATAWKPWNE